VIGELPFGYTFWSQSLNYFFLIFTNAPPSADATVPATYRRAFGVVVVDSTGFEEISVNSLLRLLNTSNLPASTIDRVCPD